MHFLLGVGFSCCDGMFGLMVDLLNASVCAGAVCRGRCAGERGVPGGREDEEGLQKGLGAGELTYLADVDFKYSWYEVHFHVE